MEQTELKKVTSIDWLMTQLYKKGFIKEIDGNEPIVLMNQAKEMEKEQQGYSEEEVKQAYAEGSFAQLRYIDGLPYIARDRWFEQFKTK